MTESPYSFDTSATEKKPTQGSPSKVFRAACIGTGGIYSAHLSYLATRPDIELVGLCDIKEENLKRSQDKFGGEAYADFNEMLDKTRPDAVWICTPPQVREDPLLACADRGIPVLCEKPVERSVDKARKIAEQLRERKARVQIGYCFRTLSTVEQLKKEMADDKIHLIQSFYGCGMSLSKGMASWFYDKELSGGALVDQATHSFDLLRMLMGEVKEVCGMTSNPVNAKKEGYTIDELIGLSMLFENGTLCTHAHTWVGDAWRNEILFSGEKRIYRLNLGGGKLTVEGDGDPRTFGQGETSLHAFQNIVFMDMLTSGDWSKNPCDYDDGLKTLELTLKCDKAIS